MSIIKCSNQKCGEKYNVKFEKCPFCGTPIPLSDEERKSLIDKNVVIDNCCDKDATDIFSGWVICSIWASILFVGFRAIISSFTNMAFNPFVGCLTLGLTIIGIVSLVYILRAKKWALFMWMAYRLAAGIVNGFINSKFDLATNIIIAIANIGLMVLVLQIKKNGVSAWSVIFNNQSQKLTNK